MVYIRIAGANRQEIGKNFERAIKSYLEKKGYVSIKPRHTESYYELDFIGELEKIPIFVECKAHQNNITLPMLVAFFW